MASTPDIERIAQQLSARPDIVQAIQADQKKIGGRFQYMHGTDPRAREGPKDVLSRYGIDFPDAEDYQIQVDPDGRVALKRANWFQRNADWVVPVATIGTLGVASALTAPSGVVASTAPATVPSTGGVAAGAGTAGTAGTVAAAAGPSLLHSLLPTIIGAGAGVAGQFLANKGASDAAKVQNEYLNKALDVQERVRLQDRADTQAYRELGRGAVGSLGHLSGITISPESMKPPEIPSGVATTYQPPQQQGGTLAGLGQQTSTQPGMVRMQAPDGSWGMVPQNRVAEAQAAIEAAKAKGGTRV